MEGYSLQSSRIQYFLSTFEGTVAGITDGCMSLRDIPSCSVNVMGFFTKTATLVQAVDMPPENVCIVKSVTSKISSSLHGQESVKTTCSMLPSYHFRKIPNACTTVILNHQPCWDKCHPGLQKLYREQLLSFVYSPPCRNSCTVVNTAHVFRFTIQFNTPKARTRKTLTPSVIPNYSKYVQINVN